MGESKGSEGSSRRRTRAFDAHLGSLASSGSSVLVVEQPRYSLLLSKPFLEMEEHVLYSRRGSSNKIY